MAAPWGLGEEAFTMCNMDFFPMNTLDETSELMSKETLEALQSCLDSSVISVLEDTPTIDPTGLDEESEATLLTALTEILDNVDDENLSPFDTLPDSDLLSHQKGRELSPLRRLLCLSRSSPEKDTLCSTRAISTGKSLPRMQVDSLQRSDGEEEEDHCLSLSPYDGLLDWDSLNLPLPVTFEQDGEDELSVSLGDLVRHMHPCCMTFCLQKDKGEQILPERGILLEVFDQAESGEPILAIPDMSLPLSLSGTKQTAEDKNISTEVEDLASEDSELIVVDDDEDDLTITEAPVKVATPPTPALHLNVKDEIISSSQKDAIKEKTPSRRRKKKKSMEQCQPEPVEGRLLRSSTLRKKAKGSPEKPKKIPVKQEKKHKLPKIPLVSAQNSSVKPNKRGPCPTEMKTKITTTTLSPKENVEAVACVSPSQDTVLLNNSSEKNQPSVSPIVVSPQLPDETQKHLVLASENLGGSSSAPPAVHPQLSLDSPAAVSSSVTPLATPAVGGALPPVVPVVSEPKPKSLSLEEYRRLRQQKKPTPVEKQENSSTKWPSLPELPKELPPIPCLPDPSPSDRRPIPITVEKEVKEIRPAWQPRGPTAPPTPEALLVPPAYMVASSRKVSATTTLSKPQQIPNPVKPSSLQEPLTSAPNSVKSLPSYQNTTAKPPVSSEHQNSGSLALLKQVSQVKSSADEKFSLAPLREKSEADERPQSQSSSPKSTEDFTTTTEVIKPTTATVSVQGAPQKTTAVFLKVPEVVAATALKNPITLDSRSIKPVPNIAELSVSPALTSKTLTPNVEPVMLETKEKPTTAPKSQRTKSPTRELIEAFTSEIGIEAADLTSLLEQFEETQAKEEQCVPEVSGRAAAVGNSSFNLAPEKMVVERVKANDLSSITALTPPATPPDQMWRPLAPVALLGKGKVAKAAKWNPLKITRIEGQLQQSIMLHSKPPPPAAVVVTPELACMDHDYCLPNKGTSTEESGKRWNVKPKSLIMIRPIKQPTSAITQTPPAALTSSVQLKTNPGVPSKTCDSKLTEVGERTDGMQRNPALDTPDASPTRQDTNAAVNCRRSYERSYRHHAASRTPSPRSNPKERTRGRSRKRSHRSPSPMSSGSESDSHSSRSRSRSHSPSKKRYHSRLSESSSSCSSRSSSRSSSSVSRSPPRKRRCSYSSSCSGSWSRSRSRSQSPHKRAQWSGSRQFYSPSYKLGHSEKINVEEVKRRKEKAIEERRVVYVGRIQGTMTQQELKERFSFFGKVEECTLHFRDYGDNYGFVTYYNTKDAFTAIENGSKLRNPDELPFDLCFGGRRQFCQSSYSDLDSRRENDPVPAKGKFNALDFDTLLKQAQQNMKR